MTTMPERRGSAVPTSGMIATRIMELRKRRGLMITLFAVNVGLPALFLLIRLLAHAFAPRTNPPAGGHDIFMVLVAGFLPTFGFIAAIMVGCTAGSRDLAEGMFRHLVVTGRSRLALYASSCIGSYSNKVLIRHERALAARLMSQIGLFCTAAQGGPGRRQIDSSRTPGGRPAAAGLPSHTSPVR